MHTSKDITEHSRCSFSEIPDFLSETEITRLLELAESGRLENSDVFHNSVDTLLSQNSFEYWDLNRDDVINTDEVHILVMQRFWVLYHGISHGSLVISWYTHWPEGSCVYRENKLTREILHRIPRKSVSYTHRQCRSQHIQCEIRATHYEKV